MPSPTPFQLLSALMGRTTLLYLAIAIVTTLLFGLGGAYFMGFLAAAIFSLFMYLRKHRFLVSEIRLSEDQTTVKLIGHWLELGFKPKEEVLPLSNLHKLELRPRQWYEDADELRVIKRSGMSVELKGIPGYITEQQLEAVNSRLSPSSAKPEGTVD